MTEPNNFTRTLTAAQRAEAEASFQKLLEEARSGTPVPADIAAYAKMGRVPMDKDMRVVAQNQLPPPPGWLARRRRQQEWEEMHDESEAPPQEC